MLLAIKSKNKKSRTTPTFFPVFIVNFERDQHNGHVLSFGKPVVRAEFITKRNWGVAVTNFRT